MRGEEGERNMTNRFNRREAMAVVASVAASRALAQEASGNAAGSSAADFPKAQIKFICSAAVGGGNDLIARIMGLHLQPRWGQNVVVDNKPGAGNNIAADFVYRSAPDGYTLLVSPPAPVTVNKALFRDLRYDPDKLEAVSITSYIPNVLIVSKDSPFKTAQAFIAFARANPDKLTYASQGIGTTGHLTGALFEQLTGAKQAHVPFNGAAPAVTSVLSGQVDFMFSDIGTVLSLASDGKLRMLATLTKEAPPVARDLPTIAAVGMPELLSDTWTVFTAPPGTPLAIREKYNAAMREIIFLPEVAAQLQKIGVVPWGLSVAQSEDLIRKETKRWGEVVRIAGVKVE